MLLVEHQCRSKSWLIPAIGLTVVVVLLAQALSYLFQPPAVAVARGEPQSFIDRLGLMSELVFCVAIIWQVIAALGYRGCEQ